MYYVCAYNRFCACVILSYSRIHRSRATFLVHSLSTIIFRINITFFHLRSLLGDGNDERFKPLNLSIL